MTLREILRVSQTSIKVLHGGSGKIVAYPLNAERHEKYLDIEILDLWSDVIVNKCGFDSFVKSIICCYISSYDYDRVRRNNEGENQ